MKKLFPLLLLLGVVTVHASPFSDAFEPLKIVDRGADKPDFARYRINLLKVIGRRDAQALKACLSPQIQYSFGLGKPGVAGFYSVWKPAEAKSELWKKLAFVVGNGGSFDKQGEFTAPSWYANWPEGKDESEWGVVAETSVKVYFEPTESSKQLPEIGKCWVHLNYNGNTQMDSNFTGIDLPKSMQNPYKVESAFVKADRVHHLLGYRASFARRQGRWEMTSFIAGD